jgi:hypothetical protein
MREIRLYRKWDFNSVMELAQKYSNATQFRKECYAAYKWAHRNGVLKEVTKHMKTTTDPLELMRKIKMELDSSRRNYLIACKMQNTDPTAPRDHDDESISAGVHLDFDLSMYDQCAEERSSRALDHIEQLQKVGTPEQVQRAWDLYLDYQELSCTNKATVMPGEESELEQEVLCGDGEGEID